MKKRNAFTLIELLAVLILLAVIGLITLPIVNNSINNSRERALEETIRNIEHAALTYSVENNLGTDSYYKALTLEELKTKGYLENKDVINPVTREEMTGCIIYVWESNQYNFEYDEKCDIPEVYTDNSGANEPKLLDNMIPIRYDGTNWVYADTKVKVSSELSNLWYNYDEQMWANAVILNDGVSKKVGDIVREDEIALWYVWIPRYTYTIFNANNEGMTEQLINIKFESGTSSSGTVSCTDAINQTDSSGNKISEICTDTTNGGVTNGKSTYTHPAFTFGNTKLTGFWIGKFEISTTDTTCYNTPSVDNCNKVHKLAIKPSVSSLRFANVSNLFTSIQNIDSDYGINGNSHMMRNMEWGAVAYLKQSKYGLGATDITINNNSSFITGGGENNAYITNVGQSTTGNVYGVYDMSGGSWEYAMGNMVNSGGSFYASSSGISQTLDTKYYDAYTYDETNTTHARGKLGDATRETLKTFGNNYGGWYGDYAYFPYSTTSWFLRGGIHGYGASAGVFNFYSNNGYAYGSGSSRAVAFR